MPRKTSRAALPALALLCLAVMSPVVGASSPAARPIVPRRVRRSPHQTKPPVLISTRLRQLTMGKTMAAGSRERVRPSSSISGHNRKSQWVRIMSI